MYKITSNKSKKGNVKTQISLNNKENVHMPRDMPYNVTSGKSYSDIAVLLPLNTDPSTSFSNITSDKLICPSCLYATSNTDQFQSHLKLHASSVPFQSQEISSRHVEHFNNFQLAKLQTKNQIKKAAEDIIHNYRNTMPNNLQLNQNFHYVNPKLQFNNGYVNSIPNLDDWINAQLMQPATQLYQPTNHIRNLPLTGSMNTYPRFRLEPNGFGNSGFGYLEVNAEGVKFISVDRDTKYFRFRCQFCKYIASSKHHLERHMNGHFNIKRLSCKECDYRTNRKDHMQRHNLTHCKDRSFICSRCFYIGQSNEDLMQHSVKHTKRRPYNCPECTFVTISRETYKPHMKSCCSKFFRCCMCDYISLRKDHLKRHLKIHFASNNTNAVLDNTYKELKIT